MPLQRGSSSDCSSIADKASSCHGCGYPSESGTNLFLGLKRGVERSRALAVAFLAVCVKLLRIQGGSSAEERKPLPVAICSLLLLVITTKPLASCLFSLPSLRGGRNSYEQANGVCKPLTRGRL